MVDSLVRPAAGDLLPRLERRLDSARLVAYAGATWDWHQLHHDNDAARRLGLERPIVDGQMFGALLAQHIQRWAGGAARIKTLSLRYRSFVYAGETVVAEGRVTAVDEQPSGTVVDVDQWVRRADTDIVRPAHARVLLPPGLTASIRKSI